MFEITEWHIQRARYWGHVLKYVLIAGAVAWAWGQIIGDVLWTVYSLFRR